MHSYMSGIASVVTRFKQHTSGFSVIFKVLLWKLGYLVKLTVNFLHKEKQFFYEISKLAVAVFFDEVSLQFYKNFVDDIVSLFSYTINKLRSVVFFPII